MQWQLTSKADQFDPGAFAEEWPGAIDFALATNGKVDKGPPATIKLDKLSGTLRQRPFSGSADLTFASPLAVNGTLDSNPARARVGVEGRAADQTDIDANLAIANLADWVPQTNGSLRGTSLRKANGRTSTRRRISPARKSRPAICTSKTSPSLRT